MKLGELKSAIRKTKGNPHVNLYPLPITDKGMRIVCQKTELLAELDRIFPGGKTQETGWEFVESTGLLRCMEYDRQVGLSDDEKAQAFAGAAKDNPPIKTPAPAHDDDDLLLDDEPAPPPPADDDDDGLLV